MNKVLDNIIKEYELYKGQLVFTDSGRSEQLIGIGTDNEDYYYITYNGRRIVWNTCVGKYIPLKFRFTEEEYNNLVRTAKLNYVTYFDAMASNEDELLCYLKQLTYTTNEQDKVIKGYYWTLN